MDKFLNNSTLKNEEDSLVQVVEQCLIQERFIYALLKESTNDFNHYDFFAKDLINNQEIIINSITTIENVAKNMYNTIKKNIVHIEHINDVVYDLIVQQVEV